MIFNLWGGLRGEGVGYDRGHIEEVTIGYYIEYGRA